MKKFNPKIIAVSLLGISLLLGIGIFSVIKNDSVKDQKSLPGSDTSTNQTVVDSSNPTSTLQTESTEKQLYLRKGRFSNELAIILFENNVQL